MIARPSSKPQKPEPQNYNHTNWIIRKSIILSIALIISAVTVTIAGNSVLNTTRAHLRKERAAFEREQANNIPIQIITAGDTISFKCSSGARQADVDQEKEIRRQLKAIDEAIGSAVIDEHNRAYALHAKPTATPNSNIGYIDLTEQSRVCRLSPPPNGQPCKNHVS